MRRIYRLAAIGAGAAAVYTQVIRGALTIDLRVGRRIRPLGPIRLQIDAERETVFDVISQPYLGKTPRAMREKLEVLERGADMVLAAHFTPVGRLTATTVETVRFERPERVSFRVLRGPVPHVIEHYELRSDGDRTELEYGGEIGADLWQLGEWWAGQVAAPWERTVRSSLELVKDEAERRAGQSSR